MSHRQPDARLRVLRWLLVVLAVAGLGILAGGDCLDDAPPAVAAAGVTLVDVHGHVYGGGEWHGPSAADDCHVQPAARSAATTTVTVGVQPPAGFRTLPVGAPPTACTPRQPGAPALTDIGISRT